MHSVTEEGDGTAYGAFTIWNLMLQEKQVQQRLEIIQMLGL